MAAMSLSMAVRAFCDEDSRWHYPVPTYSLYPVLAALQDCRAIEIPFNTDFSLPDNLWTTSAALTRYLQSECTIRIFINTQIVEICAKD
jgi:histidinol-phosphate/aromatic aminotransferase/cobyric acid decarboxylase-like protein